MIVVIFAMCIAIFIIILHIKEKYRELNDLRKKVLFFTNKENGIAAREERIASREKESEYEISIKREALDDDIKSWKKELSHDQLILDQKRKTVEKELNEIRLSLDEKANILEKLQSNLTAIPYMASIIADFDTRGLELLAQKLDWGNNQERAKKVKSIREIRKDAAEAIAQCKEAQYQLDYAIRMFPALADFLETDYNRLPILEISDMESSEHDGARDYLSKEEYSLLSTVERNQLALDRYREAHRKTNWQIGRDYELYVGYKYTQKGYNVDYFGSNNGLEDLGRDLIAKKGNSILIIQCKYWSSKKTIHENHINQLYGTMICYCLEHNVQSENVQGILVTNISLSDTAKRFANYLGISFVENYPLGEYPCIKCNINRSQEGEITKIYHLPFDQQYDSCKIDSPGEFFAMTVEEAEAAGFRRAFRWHSNNW